jgi:hypothetical protein
MSDFLLIAPGNATEYQIDEISGITGINSARFAQVPCSVEMADLNERMRTAGLLPEGKEVVEITYMAEFNRLWFVFGAIT